MTNEELTIIDAEIDKLRATIAELVSVAPHVVVTGEIKGVNVLEQKAGYLHYIEVGGAEEADPFVVFYPDSAAAEIGSLVSSASYITAKTIAKPNGFGTLTLWIYGINDILFLDGQRISGN